MVEKMFGSNFPSKFYSLKPQVKKKINKLKSLFNDIVPRKRSNIPSGSHANIDIFQNIHAVDHFHTIYSAHDKFLLYSTLLWLYDNIKVTRVIEINFLLNLINSVAC